MSGLRKGTRVRLTHIDDDGKPFTGTVMSGRRDNRIDDSLVDGDHVLVQLDDSVLGPVAYDTRNLAVIDEAQT